MKHDGWEADCKGGTVQDMLDLTGDSDSVSQTNVAYLGVAARLIEAIRDPDGEAQEADAAPAALVVAVLKQHPFFLPS